MLAVQADLTAVAEVTAWARRAEEELGPVQAVVSCAGITRDRPLALLTDADWRAVTDTSLDGVFHLCRAVLPAMMGRRSGRIVAVSSVSRRLRPRHGRRRPRRDRRVHPGAGQPDPPLRHPGQRGHAGRARRPDRHDLDLAGRPPRPR